MPITSTVTPACLSAACRSLSCGSRTAGSGSARPPRSAPRLRRRASSAPARGRSASSRRRGSRSRRRRSRGRPRGRSRRRTAPCSARCGSRGRGSPNASRLRPLAGTKLEGPVQHVERLAHLLRIRVGAEVDGPPPVALAREHDAGVFVLDRDGSVGNDLSSRSRTLNGGRWRLTRFCSRWSASRLRRGDDDLDVAHPLDQAADALPCVT